MAELGRLSYARPVEPADDSFLYDVFATTWESEVSALPNQNLARHVLRIQHIAQERRYTSRFPGHRRFVLTEAGERIGRLYVLRSGAGLHVVDLTLLPEFRGRGLGARVVRDLVLEAAAEDVPVTLRVGRTNTEVTSFYARLGFDLVDVDDLDNFFEWRPLARALPFPRPDTDDSSSPVVGTTAR